MDDPAAMGVFERGGDGDRNVERHVDAQRSGSLQQGEQRFSLDEWRDVEEYTLVLALIEDIQNVGMTDTRKGTGFTLKARCPVDIWINDARVQYLDRNGARQVFVTREIHRAHRAASNEPLDVVATIQRVSAQDHDSAITSSMTQGSINHQSRIGDQRQINDRDSKIGNGPPSSSSKVFLPVD